MIAVVIIVAENIHCIIFYRNDAMFTVLDPIKIPISSGYVGPAVVKTEVPNDLKLC